jgi:hypothetical protein
MVSAAALLTAFAGFSAPTASADEMSLPAVSAINAKLDVSGGTQIKKDFVLSTGSVAFPLDHDFGMQVDAAGGAWGNTAVFGAGGHFFWRDPEIGLLGVYGSYQHAKVLYSVNVSRFAGEAAFYYGPFTLQGVGGYEYGGLAKSFFDRLDAVFYPQDFWNVSVGHRYTAGTHALALGSEVQIPGLPLSLFAQGRLGGHYASGVWAGLRVYFGDDKPLIKRHREDDPPNEMSNDFGGFGCNADSAKDKLRYNYAPVDPCATEYPT